MRTVIFAVPSDTQTSRLDSRKTQSDGLSQRGGVDMRNVVLLADAAVGHVEALARDVAIGEGRIVRSEPGRKRDQDTGLRNEKHRGARGRRDSPSLHEYLLRPIRSTGGGRTSDVLCHLFQGLIGTVIARSTKGSSRVHALRHATEDLGVGAIHHLVVEAGVLGRVIDEVLGLAGGRVHAVGVSGVWGGSEAGTDVTVAQMALEGGVGEIVIGWRVGGGAEIGGGEGVGGGVGRVGRVAVVLRPECDGGGVEGGTIEVFSGWDRRRISHKETLGRLGSGIRRMGVS